MVLVGRQLPFFHSITLIPLSRSLELVPLVGISKDQNENKVIALAVNADVFCNRYHGGEFKYYKAVRRDLLGDFSTLELMPLPVL